ncbi:hypothetical protein LX36DRAFT_432709 [Colletotrichum falcatum]|nr:hypothetical protein LX36DRAFT_432709 [Colletotrichum falcatum]
MQLIQSRSPVTNYPLNEPFGIRRLHLEGKTCMDGWMRGICMLTRELPRPPAEMGRDRQPDSQTARQTDRQTKRQTLVDGESKKQGRHE